LIFETKPKQRVVRSGSISDRAGQSRPPVHVCFVLIVLQKSKVAGLRIFAKNPKQEAIADSYNLNRVTEVAYEVDVRR